MFFWILAGCIGILTGLAIWRAVVVAGASAVASTAEYDLGLYRDQLRELDRDIARGVITEEDAARARTEISRRVLEADRLVQAETTSRQGRALPVALGLLVTLGVAVFVYSTIGAPGYPDLPLAERVAQIEAERAARPSQAEIEAQVPALPQPNLSPDDEAVLTALRTQMAETPNDIEGGRLLVRSEANLRNYPAAKLAQAQLVAALGDAVTARDLVDLARLHILAAGGYVSPEAEAILLRAFASDPDQLDAQFLLGAMYNSQGRPDLTFPLWMTVLQSSPPDAPLVGIILQEIEIVAFFAGQRLDPALLPAPQPGAVSEPERGPSPSQIEAAEDMSAEDRMMMIQDMVARLNERLATEGGTEDDWARLITAYGVLGQFETAERIMAEAREVFAGSARAMVLFDQAQSLLEEAQR